MNIATLFLSFASICAASMYFWQKSLVKSREFEIDRLREHISKLNTDINDLKKKQRMSSDVLEVLSDLKRNGTVLKVERINQDDIFYHNGGQYR